MTLLPYPPRRSHRAAFWGCLHLGMAPGVFSLAWLTISLHAAVIALTVQVMILSAGLLWARLPLFFYRAWNRLARLVSKVVSRWVLLVTVVLMRIMPDAPRLTDEAYASEGGRWASMAPPHGSTAELTRAAEPATSKTRWWGPLLPQLKFLSLVAADHTSDSLPDDTYTLF